MEEHIENLGYEILTPAGWKDFSGIRKLVKPRHTTLSIENDNIRCSTKHLLKTTEGWKSSGEIESGDELIGDGGSVSVISTQTIESKIELFDVLEVEGHEFYSNGVVSHNCDFIGSSSTLISSHKLKSLAWIDPIIKNTEGLCVYEEPKEDHVYVCCVDTARGQGLDYSAFVLIDITNPPYRMVSRYRNNIISPMVYPTVIKSLCKQFNGAYCLVEINDIGSQVADVLYSDLEYENVLMCSTKGRKGQVISGGFGSGGVQFGVRTTMVVKKLGCSVLKSLLEEDKLIIEDLETINEMMTFVSKRQSYEADDGHTDDLMMCLVLFAWLTRQDYFKDITDIDVRTDIYENKIQEL